MRCGLRAEAAALLAAHPELDFKGVVEDGAPCTALSMACERVDLLMVRVLLEGGVSAAEPDPWSSPFFWGSASKPIIYFAAGEAEQCEDRADERVAILRLLFAHGARGRARESRLADSVLIQRAIEMDKK